MNHAVAKFPDLRVLVVEDHLRDLEIIESILMGLACDFDVIDNHIDALEIHLQNPFDFILMDVVVPDSESYEAIKRIKASPGATGRAHIVPVITTFSPLDAAKLSLMGVTEHIKKPLTIRDLEQLFLRWRPDRAVR